MTQSFSDGSTIFGNDSDDTHIFTGSLFVTGALFVTQGITYNTDPNISQVLIYDSASGQFFFTGSYGGGGTNEGEDTDWGENVGYLSSSKSVYITGSTTHDALRIKSSRETGSTVIRVEGSASNATPGPELFSVRDITSGSIFTLNDISGLPIFDVDSDGKIVIDGNIEFGGYNNNMP